MTTTTKAKILLSRAAAPTEGAVVEAVQQQPLRNYQATLTGTGQVDAVVEIQVSNDGFNWLVMCRFTMSGTNFDTGGFAAENPAQYTRAVLKSISGTGAAVDVTMGD